MQTEKWFGATGHGWVFTVDALPVAFEHKGRNGNYVFCRRDGNSWRAILIGQGNLEEAVTQGQKNPCIAAKGATHVHWRFTGGGEPMRREIDQDLRSGHPSAKAPAGCGP
ncbi:MAG: hypothetical protein FJX65_07825 [Alphaproteobacteria bacterium]|nr:hypothetical protein [Alphaproteobacteria bacterium]